MVRVPFQETQKSMEEQKTSWGLGTQTKLSLREEREKGCFFTPHALPQVASQSCGPPQSHPEGHWSNPEKTAEIGHSKNTRPISNPLITSNLQFSLPWLIDWGLFFFKYLPICLPYFPVSCIFSLWVLISSLFCSQITICHH